MKKIFFSIFLLCFCFLSVTNAQKRYVLYGTTGWGGKYNKGMIYKYDPITSKYDTLLSLSETKNGIFFCGELTLASNGLLYGATELGGSMGHGVLFSFNPATYKYNVLVNFDSIYNGRGAYGVYLMQAKNGLLYGTTSLGGVKDSGVFFSYNTDTGKDSLLFNFSPTLGFEPLQTVVEDTNNGLLYGATSYGGTKNIGVIYGYNPTTNKDSIVLSFDSMGGNGNAANPAGTGFLIASNGLLYNTTVSGGLVYNGGTLFSFNPVTGKYITLVEFSDTNGRYPDRDGLMQANDGLIYGVTQIGGGPNEGGVLYSYDPIFNIEKRLVSFDENGNNWRCPLGGLVQNSDNGLLYGITNEGGTNNDGVLYSYNINTNQETVLVNFNGTNGAYPWGTPTLVLVNDTATGINEMKPVNEEVKVYPNPANTTLHVEINLPQGAIAYFELFDVTSTKVEDTELKGNNTVLSLNNLADGIYFYKILDKNKNVLKTDKISVIH